MPTARKILNNARMALKDENKNEYQDTELLMYMTDSVDYLSNMLAAQRSIYTRKNVWVTASPAPLPHDFLNADGVDKNIAVYNDHITLNVLPAEFRYFYKFAHPEQLDEEVYIPPEFVPAVTQYVISRALLRNEYSVTAEQRIENVYTASILEVAKRRGGVVKDASRQIKYRI